MLNWIEKTFPALFTNFALQHQSNERKTKSSENNRKLKN